MHNVTTRGLKKLFPNVSQFNKKDRFNSQVKTLQLGCDTEFFRVKIKLYKDFIWLKFTSESMFNITEFHTYHRYH